MKPSYRSSGLSDHTSAMLMSQCSRYSDPKGDAELAAFWWTPRGMITMVVIVAVAVISLLTKH